MSADPTTSTGCLGAAMQALLRGDTTERDRLCDRANMLLLAEEHAAKVKRLLAVDFYVNRRGEVIPTRLMARAARAIN